MSAANWLALVIVGLVCLLGYIGVKVLSMFARM